MAKNYRVPKFSSPPESTGAGSYDKILAIYHNASGNMPFSRQNKTHVGIKNSQSYNAIIQDFAESGMYQRLAGIDINSIFFPYQTRYSSVSNLMPAFHQDASGVYYTANSGAIIDIGKLLPFKFNKNDNRYVYYTPNIASGIDGIKGVVSSDKFLGSSDIYRDISDIRSIGHRLPMVGVGWGYTTDGLPVPSNSGSLLFGSGVNSFSTYKFKGGYTNGYEVNPDDYIAAPIDLRYDPQRNVWTGPRGFWAQVTDGSGVFVTSSGVFAGNGSGLITAYSWREVVPADNGDFIQPPRFRTGTYNNFPAFEVNNNTVASGTVVYFPPKEREDRYHFAVGGSSNSGTVPTGEFQYMVYQMVAQNSAGFDFVRGHPVLE